jgi:hypothetical protein
MPPAHDAASWCSRAAGLRLEGRDFIDGDFVASTEEKTNHRDRRSVQRGHARLNGRGREINRVVASARRALHSGSAAPGAAGAP